MSIIQNIILSHLGTYESAHINELAEFVNANTYRHHSIDEIVAELMGLVMANRVATEDSYVWLVRAAE
ncbi:hypothetical protein R84981_002844 [Carnimonas sp. R-84981]|uniref:hypothetical protein n=1 Tax=Carnimonas bestiolae TaxID=3402172 RepID=UPI003EDC9895